MKNITELRNTLCSNLTKIESGEIPLQKSLELCRTAQTIVNVLKIEIDYHKLIKSKKSIKFLENDDEEV